MDNPESLPRLLFNASNLHVGGGLQVAVSVITEWVEMGFLPSNLEIWVSSEIDSDLRSLGCDVSALPAYRVIDTYGIGLLFSSIGRSLSGFDRVFTLFGPLYRWQTGYFSITGFAQAWIICPNNEVSQRLPILKRILLRGKFLVQKMFFRQADLLVAELDHVAASITSVGLCHRERVVVVKNCLGSIYSQPERWVPLCRGLDGEKQIRIGFLGRNYDHKNTTILPEIAESLLKFHGLDVDFFVTFTDSEWRQCGTHFQRSIRNVGAVGIAECPAFYEAMDAMIFPSLLECFSAMPLEALAMGKPLFASDRDFNRDVCGDHAMYFDPHSPESAARRIAEYFLSDPGERAKRILTARQHALKFSSARTRAEEYLRILAMPST